MKVKSNPFLRYSLALAASSAVLFANAATYDWTGATDSNFTTGSNWAGGVWTQWSDYNIGGTPTNTTLTIDGYFGISSLTLQSGLTTDIVINAIPGTNPVIMGTDQSSSLGLITIAADSRNLTINGEYIASTAVTWNVGAGRTLTMAGQLNNWYNPASLVKNGAGTVVLGSNNGYSGSTTINGGVISNGAAAGVSIALRGLTLNGGELAATNVPDASLGNFHLQGDVTVGGSTRSTISADLRVVNNQTRDFNVGSTGDPSGVDLLISGKLGHQNGVAWGYASKSGVGTMKMSGVNELGGMTVNAGRLILEDTAIGWTFPVQGLTNNSQVEFSVTSGSQSSAANISGTGALSKSGTGSLTLSGNNSYTGGTTINYGTLVASRNTLGTGAVVINNGGTLYVNDQWVLCGINDHGVAERNIGTLTINPGGILQFDATTGFANGATNLYINGGLITGGPNNHRGDLFLYNGNEQITAGGATTSTIASVIGLTGNNNSITVDGGSTLNITGLVKNSDWAGNGGGSGGFIKAGNGTLTLAAANTYNGSTTINAGTLAIQNGYSSSGFVISTGAVLELNVASGTRDYASTTFSGTGILRKTGDGGAIWGGATANFALGAGSLIDVQAGSLTGGSHANENWSNNLASLNVAGGAFFHGVEANVRVDALTGNGTLTSGYPGAGYQNFTFGVNNGSGTFSGVLADSDTAAGNFVKAGTGTQILIGNNTYTGTTTVSAGTLLVTGQLGNTAVIVESNGVIGGSGIILGSLNFDDGANLLVNLADPLEISANVTFDGFGFTNLLGWDYTTAENGTYTLLAGSNISLANVANVGLENAFDLGAGRKIYFQNGSLQAVVVPESSALLLGTLGVLGLLRRRR
jgi:autotransporter-associated beta strand protein